MLQGAYGAYRNVRDASWRVLVDYRVTSLPVPIISICNESGVQIIKNSDINELSSGEAAVSLLVDDKWYIIYDATVPVENRRFTIAHELGHIFLGHPLKKRNYAQTIDKMRPSLERDADMFAIRLLIPACVMWGLNIHTPEEISQVCGVPIQTARVRAKRMELLYGREKFLSSELEKKVYEQFKAFIDSRSK